MQTIENLAAGDYEVSVQGFFRNGNGGAQAAAVNNGEELKQLTVLVANDQEELLPNIASVMSKVPGIGDLQSCNQGEFPNMPQSAIEYFETGYYKATVRVTVGEEGKLTLGVKKDTREQMGDWTVFDNFRLTYFNVEGTTIGINDATTHFSPLTNDYYNLQGQKVTAPVKGLYIVNGKKIVK